MIMKTSIRSSSAVRISPSNGSSSRASTRTRASSDTGRRPRSPQASRKTCQSGSASNRSRSGGVTARCRASVLRTRRFGCCTIAFCSASGSAGRRASPSHATSGHRSSSRSSTSTGAAGFCASPRRSATKSGCCDGISSASPGERFTSPGPVRVRPCLARSAPRPRVDPTDRPHAPLTAPGEQRDPNVTSFGASVRGPRQELPDASPF